MDFSEDYPNKAPVVKFKSKMFHPNSEIFQRIPSVVLSADSWLFYRPEQPCIQCSGHVPLSGDLMYSHGFFSVYNDGRICLDILQNQWSPIYDVKAVLTSIQVWMQKSSFEVNCSSFSFGTAPFLLDDIAALPSPLPFFSAVCWVISLFGLWCHGFWPVFIDSRAFVCSLSCQTPTLNLQQIVKLPNCIVKTGEFEFSAIWHYLLLRDMESWPFNARNRVSWSLW